MLEWNSNGAAAAAAATAAAAAAATAANPSSKHAVDSRRCGMGLKKELGVSGRHGAWPLGECCLKPQTQKEESESAARRQFVWLKFQALSAPVAGFVYILMSFKYIKKSLYK